MLLKRVSEGENEKTREDQPCGPAAWRALQTVRLRIRACEKVLYSKADKENEQTIREENYPRREVERSRLSGRRDQKPAMIIITLDEREVFES